MVRIRCGEKCAGRSLARSLARYDFNISYIFVVTKTGVKKVCSLLPLAGTVLPLCTVAEAGFLP